MTLPPEYAVLFRTPRQYQMIEKRTPVLENFVSSLGLPNLISVECKPLAGCERKRCFVNVDEQIKKAGGTMITGWMFEEYVGMYIQGEAHGIWQSPFGKKTDITPHDLGPRRILFAPDPRVALKRGFTTPPKLIQSQDARIIAIEEFDTRLNRLFESAFTGFGQEMLVRQADVAAAAAEVGLPPAVAEFLLNARIKSSKFGGKALA